MQTYPPGTRIGPYEIASLPMTGGMGVVYFALDHSNDGRPVAIKTFRPELLPDRAARDRFLREGSAWVNLGRHPHIVCCYSVEYIDPTAFLVLELIAKEQDREDASLRSWLGQPMPVNQALLFALQIARGMQYATEKIPGFVHRDLKPENVLVGSDRLPSSNVNRLRVTDFGLATILKDEGGRMKDEDDPDAIGRTHLTRGILGTPLYMAPEQWNGEPTGVYTDVYALGCILYEILTGQHAAGGRSTSELQAAHCAGRLRPLPANLPREVSDILTRSLFLKPVERYQDWDEVTRLLEAAYAARGGGPAPEEVIPRAESLDDHGQAGRSYIAIGQSYYHIGKAEVAAGYLEKALAIACESGDRDGKAVALSSLGLTYEALGDARRAIGYHEQALSISRKAKNRKWEGADLCHLGNAYKSLGDSQRAMGYYKQSLAIRREVHDRLGEGTDLNNLGTTYFLLGDMRRVIAYCEQALAIAREIGDRRGEGNALGNLGVACKNLGEIQQAIDYYEQSLDIRSEIGDRQGEGIDLGNLGTVYSLSGDTQRAIMYYEKRLEVAREIGDKHGEGSVLGNLGSVYARSGEMQRALKYYEQALTIRREIGAIDLVASTSFNMAQLYTQQGDIRCRPVAGAGSGAYLVANWRQKCPVGAATRNQTIQNRREIGGIHANSPSRHTDWTIRNRIPPHDGRNGRGVLCS